MDEQELRRWAIEQARPLATSATETIQIAAKLLGFVATGTQRVRRKGSVYVHATDEQKTLCTQLFAADVPFEDIVKRANALSGPPLSRGSVRGIICRSGVRRPPLSQHVTEATRRMGAAKRKAA